MYLRILAFSIPLGDCHTSPQIFLYDCKETPKNCVPIINALPNFSIFGETQAKSALCKTHNNNIQQIYDKHQFQHLFDQKIESNNSQGQKAEDQDLPSQVELKERATGDGGATLDEGGVPSLGTNISPPQGMFEGDVPVLVWVGYV